MIKKTFILFIVVMILVVFGYVKLINYKDKLNSQIKEDASNLSVWVRHYPQLLTVASEPIKQSLAVVAISNKTKSELMGTITNQYGIRDDILAYILNTIPADNKQAIEAAIHYVQNDNDVLFSDNPDKSRHAFEIDRNIGLCLDVFLDNSKLYSEISHKIDALERNTPEREAHANDVEVKVLSGHIYGTSGIMANSNLSGYQDQVKFCKNGGIYWK